MRESYSQGEERHSAESGGMIFTLFDLFRDLRTVLRCLWVH